MKDGKRKWYVAGTWQLYSKCCLSDLKLFSCVKVFFVCPAPFYLTQAKFEKCLCRSVLRLSHKLSSNRTWVLEDVCAKVFFDFVCPTPLRQTETNFWKMSVSKCSSSVLNPSSVSQPVLLPHEQNLSFEWCLSHKVLRPPHPSVEQNLSFREPLNAMQRLFILS